MDTISHLVQSISMIFFTVFIFFHNSKYRPHLHFLVPPTWLAGVSVVVGVEGAGGGWGGDNSGDGMGDREDRGQIEMDS